MFDLEVWATWFFDSRSAEFWECCLCQISGGSTDGSYLQDLATARHEVSAKRDAEGGSPRSCGASYGVFETNARYFLKNNKGWTGSIFNGFLRLDFWEISSCSLCNARPLLTCFWDWLAIYFSELQYLTAHSRILPSFMDAFVSRRYVVDLYCYGSTQLVYYGLILVNICMCILYLHTTHSQLESSSERSCIVLILLKQWCRGEHFRVAQWTSPSRLSIEPGGMGKTTCNDICWQAWWPSF